MVESDPFVVNLTSEGQSMSEDFHFEVGVFTGSFIPTSANVAEWSSNWNSAGRVRYDKSTNRFAGNLDVEDNSAPFTVGKAGYIWGFRGGSKSGEWILFRATSWTWPQAEAFPPIFLQWSTKVATPVIGSINPSGDPYLMKSASVANASPPNTSWSQWKSDMLAGTLNSAPDADPDQDGVSNLIEFVLGSNPGKPEVPKGMPLAVTDIAGEKFLQLSIPRQLDHVAELTVEASDDLVHWNSGSGVTTIVENGPSQLVVRDLVPLDVAHPKRFMRLKAAIP